MRKNNAVSVRCLKDDANGINISSSSVVLSSNSEATVISCQIFGNGECEYDSLVDNRDGKTYKTVKIGMHWWMTENLDYETSDSYCYEDDWERCSKSKHGYGRLYKWSAAVGKSEEECGFASLCSLVLDTIQGVCPDGWHLPSRAEYVALINDVGGLSVVGKGFRSGSTWKRSAELGYGTDEFGFSALPVGYRHYNEGYDGAGSSTFFWSSTERGKNNAYYMSLDYQSEVNLAPAFKDYAFSVRCVKN